LLHLLLLLPVHLLGLVLLLLLLSPCWHLLLLAGTVCLVLISPGGD
jgi:hypothetical protein